MAQRHRNPVAQYFAQVWSGIATTYVGMRLTIRYFFRKPITMEYPEVRPIIPPGHRGLHGYDEEKCLACGQCVTACPVDCIKLVNLGKGKNVLITDYDVDYARCLFCNLCAEACPTDCVWLSERYDLAGYSREACVLRFARPKSAEEIEAFKAKLAQQEAERKAKLEAQKKAAEAAKAAAPAEAPKTETPTTKTEG